MRPYWKMLHPATMISPLFAALAFATGAHNLQKVLLPYPNRLDLLGHRMFEQSRRLSLTANVAIRLDFYHAFIRCQPLSRSAPSASGVYRRD
jgi:hypothetical protein